MKVSKLLCVVLTIGVLLSVSACTGDTPQETTSEYVYIPSEETTFLSQPENKINVNTSWQKNYEVEYIYYNAEQTDEELNISEKRHSSAFIVEYLDTNARLYYEKSGKDTDYYVIMPEENEQVYSKLYDSNYSDLSSMFMKLSTVSASLPTQNNVLYMYDEKVAGRDCHKYIQRAYSDGELTQSVYVWVDVEYGFAAKCEAYNDKNKKTTYWEITSFSAGEVMETETFVDLSLYDFKEKN